MESSTATSTSRWPLRRYSRCAIPPPCAAAPRVGDGASAEASVLAQMFNPAATPVHIPAGLRVDAFPRLRSEETDSCLPILCRPLLPRQVR